MLEKGLKKIALIGNPNSGKSSVFNLLTGLRQKVGNFPGVTVDKKSGICPLHEKSDVEVIDFPGTYSIYPVSKDESIVINTLLNPKDPNYPDAIVYVADVTKLEPQLLLLSQLMDLQIPVVLALNMIDVAEKEGIGYDANVLSKSLSIPVVPISGRNGTNISNLKKEIEQVLQASAKSAMQKSKFFSLSGDYKTMAETTSQILGEKNLYRSFLFAQQASALNYVTQENKDQIKEESDALQFKSVRAQVDETMQRYAKFTPLVQKVIQQDTNKGRSFSDKVDAFLTHKIIGPLVFFVLMFIVFHAVFSWSELPMDWIEGGFAFLASQTKQILPAGWLSDLISDGVIAGLGGVVVFVPQITILFLLITLLEEVGYMSRAVYMFDSIMQKFGLNGRSIVALVSSGACAVPAIMSTRTISNWKERLITIMVTPLISCSARIPVYSLLIAFVIPSYTVLGFLNSRALVFMGLYLLGIVSALLSAWVFKLILKSGEQSYLMIEMPTYRSPVLKNVIFTVKEKVLTFVLEAGKVIMIISVILWFLASFGPGKSMEMATKEAEQQSEEQNLNASDSQDLIASKRLEASYAGHFGKAIEPAIAPLGMNWKMGIALITSFAAREVFVGTMATIYSIGSAEENEDRIRDKMKKAKDPDTGAPEYNIANSFSLLLFYVFAMQCMSTLAVVKRETKSWKWPVVQFTFMLVLAYVSSFIVYQILS